jgi:hypothetical protein
MENLSLQNRLIVAQLETARLSNILLELKIQQSQISNEETIIPVGEEEIIIM